MIKNRRIKKNWSEEDVQILVWIISKYADKKSYADIEKEIVIKNISRMIRIGRQ